MPVTNLRAIATANDDDIVTDDGNEDPDAGLTARALLVLSVDISDLSDRVERIRVQVHALSRRNPVT